MQKPLIAAALTVFMASVSHAQSYDPDLGTGNSLSNNQSTILQRNAANERNGLHAFAMVPHGKVGIQSDDPANTGGGSLGYNQMLWMY